MLLTRLPSGATTTHGARSCCRHRHWRRHSNSRMGQLSVVPSWSAEPTNCVCWPGFMSTTQMGSPSPSRLLPGVLDTCCQQELLMFNLPPFEQSVGGRLPRAPCRTASILRPQSSRLLSGSLTTQACVPCHLRVENLQDLPSSNSGPAVVEVRVLDHSADR